MDIGLDLAFDAYCVVRNLVVIKHHPSDRILYELSGGGRSSRERIGESPEFKGFSECLNGIGEECTVQGRSSFMKLLDKAFRVFPSRRDPWEMRDNRTDDEAYLEGYELAKVALANRNIWDYTGVFNLN